MIPSHRERHMRMMRGWNQSRLFTIIFALWARGRPVCYPARMVKGSLALWRDRRGRVSAVRIATLLLLLVPILLAAAAGFSDEGFGARPLNNLIHRAGYWTLMFVLLALAITPLTRIARFGALMDVRRMTGVGALPPENLKTMAPRRVCPVTLTR